LIADLRRALVGEPEEVGVTGVDQWYVSELAVDCDTEPLLRVLAHGLLAAGWRPPLPKQDLRTMRSLLAGIIDGHFGDDHRETATAAAEEIIGRGWLDKVADVGPPEPVATTLRRIIRDLESEAAGPQRHTHAGIALSNYALRLRSHPALDGDADAGWPPLPDSETEWGFRLSGTGIVVDCDEQGARDAAGGQERLELVSRPVGPWAVTS
jgi:hypothetical protein